MALDSFFICALARELNTELKGARIDKVLMPEKRKIVFQLYRDGQNRKLLFSIGSGSTRVYRTEADFDNPSEPLMFCLFLRKHLTGAVIESVRAEHCERVMLFSLAGRTAFDEHPPLTIAVEMLGKLSNFILLDESGHILDCLIRSGYNADYSRGINPGSLYRLPPKQEKTDLFEAGQEELVRLCAERDPSFPAEDWLVDSFLGFSPVLGRELAFRAGGNNDRLAEVLWDYRWMCESCAFEPLLYRSEGKRTELSAYPLTHKGFAPVVYGGFSEMLDAYYAEKDREEYRNERSRTLLKQAVTIRDRLSRKIAAQTDELAAAEDAEEIRKSAEFVRANIHRIRKGDTLLHCTDYYAEDQHEVTIPLDPLKTPQQNANALYKSYGKKKTAARVLRELLVQEKTELEYIGSVIDAIRRADSGRDLDEIRSELVAGGFVKPDRKRSRRQPVSAPVTLRTKEGFEIRIGRNNTQNDLLTFRQAQRWDLWFHIQHWHGSHVVLSCGERDATGDAIRTAASLAVAYSEADCAGKHAVDYTEIRNVSRRKGALPGMVLYRDYQTILVSGEEWKDSIEENGKQ